MISAGLKYVGGVIVVQTHSSALKIHSTNCTVHAIQVGSPLSYPLLSLSLTSVMELFADYHLYAQQTGFQCKAVHGTA